MIRAFVCLCLVLSAGPFVAFSASAAIPKKQVVVAKKAEFKELSDTLTYPARVEPQIRAAVTSETDGVVSKIVAPLGSSVKTGTRLLVIRNTDPVYQYSPVKVTSPVSGIVSRVDVTEGSRVARGDKLLLVTDPSQVRVIVEVAAQDVPLVQAGLETELKFTSGLAPLKLRVRGISPFVDPATGTAVCELEILKGGKLPPPGVIGRVDFRVNVRKGFSIPDSAITYRGKDPYVRVVKDGKAKLVAVIIGKRQSGIVEITKGLAPGDIVVERSSGFIADGEEVEVAPEKTQNQG